MCCIALRALCIYVARAETHSWETLCADHALMPTQACAMEAGEEGRQQKQGETATLRERERARDEACMCMVYMNAWEQTPSIARYAPCSNAHRYEQHCAVAHARACVALRCAHCVYMLRARRRTAGKRCAPTTRSCLHKLAQWRPGKREDNKSRERQRH